MPSPEITRRFFGKIFAAGCAAEVLSKVAEPSNLLSAITPEPSLIDSYQKYLFHKNTVDHNFDNLSCWPAAQALGPDPAINSRLESLDRVLSHLAESITNGASVIARVSRMSNLEIHNIKSDMTAQGIDTWEFSGMMTRGGRSLHSSLYNKLGVFGPGRCLAASGPVPPEFDYAQFAQNWRDALFKKMGSRPSQEAIQVLDTIHGHYVSGLSQVRRRFDGRSRKKGENANQEHSPASQPNAPKLEAWKILADGYGQAAQSTFSDLVVPKPTSEC